MTTSIPIVPTTPTTPSTEVRPFPFAHLQSTIDTALATLPPDKHGAVVAYADSSGAGLAAMARLDDGWSFVMSVDKTWQGPVEAQAEVRFSW